MVTNNNIPYPLTFWQKIKYVITKPNDFFDIIINEEGIKQSIIFFLLLQLLVLPFNIVVLVLLNLGVKLIVPIYVSRLIMGIIFFFLILIFYNMLILWFGGKQGLVRTYQSFIYGSTPGILLNWVPILNIIAAFYSMYLTIVGLIKLQKMQTSKAILAYFIPIIAVFIFGLTTAVFLFIAY